MPPESVRVPAPDFARVAPEAETEPAKEVVDPWLAVNTRPDPRLMVPPEPERDVVVWLLLNVIVPPSTVRAPLELSEPVTLSAPAEIVVPPV